MIWGGGPVRVKRVDPFRRIDCGLARRRVRAGQAQKNVSENTGGLAVGFSAFLPVGAVGSQFCKATARDKLGSS